jgi:hypothetical protein
MSRSIALGSTFLALPLLLLFACGSPQSRLVLPAQHPAEAELGRQRPVCIGCHEAGVAQLAYAEFNHTAFFADNHRSVAARHSQVCGLCHQQSFCNACHAGRIELKPSLKEQTDTFRRMPHRGDYLSRHRIDGKIDPTSCFRCHGNPKTAQRCATCHGS